MIIIRLTGGLGNQMFQYALARHLSIIKKTECLIDITPYNWDKLRVFELNDIFSHKIKIADSKDIEKLLKKHKYSLLNRIKRKILGGDFPYYLHSTVKEKHFRFDKNILKVSANSILVGHWQSEKYFLSIKNQIIEYFSFAKEANIYYSQIIKSLSKMENTVSIHVRRSDYLNDKTTLAFHGLCSLEYYENAISYMNSKISQPFYIVISDDIEFCKNNFQNIDNKLFIENNMGADYEDLRLMNLCKHNIIANSSFSWWGAWLNQNPDKIVIAPKQWFANEEMQAQTQDLIPESWIRM